MLIGLLLYLTIRYKKIVKLQTIQLNEKDEKIKSLRQYSYEVELKRVEREHDVEKEIMTLNHTIKTLETSEKEGLKSHVVTMIEQYEKTSAQQLERANINK
jgi:hypothetical protein